VLIACILSVIYNQKRGKGKEKRDSSCLIEKIKEGEKGERLVTAFFFKSCARKGKKKKKRRRGMF